MLLRLLQLSLQVQDFAVAAQATQMEAQARAEQASTVDNDDEPEQGAVEDTSEQNTEKGKAATEQYQSVAAEFKSDSQLQVWA